MALWLSSLPNFNFPSVPVRETACPAVLGRGDRVRWPLPLRTDILPHPEALGWAGGWLAKLCRNPVETDLHPFTSVSPWQSPLTTTPAARTLSPSPKRPPSANCASLQRGWYASHLTRQDESHRQDSSADGDFPHRQSATRPQLRESPKGMICVAPDSTRRVPSPGFVRWRRFFSSAKRHAPSRWSPPPPHGQHHLFMLYSGLPLCTSSPENVSTSLQKNTPTPSLDWSIGTSM